MDNYLQDIDARIWIVGNTRIHVRKVINRCPWIKNTQKIKIVRVIYLKYSFQLLQFSINYPFFAGDNYSFQRHLGSRKRVRWSALLPAGATKNARLEYLKF